MGVLLASSTPDRHLFRLGRWQFWCELLFLGALIAYFAATSVIVDVPLCPFRHFLGCPCPTCGTTRSVWSILHGNLAAAWGCNPIGFIVVIALFRRLVTLLLPKFRWIQIANADLPTLLLLVAFFALGYARMFHVL